MGADLVLEVRETLREELDEYLKNPPNEQYKNLQMQSCDSMKNVRPSKKTKVFNTTITDYFLLSLN